MYRGDICNVDFISDVFERERPTHICHLAARAGAFPRFFAGTNFLTPAIQVYAHPSKTLTSMYTAILRAQPVCWTSQDCIAARILSTPLRPLFMVAAQSTYWRKKMRSRSLSVRMLQRRRLVSYWLTRFITCMASTRRDFDSLPCMVLVVGQIWHHSSLLIG